MTVEQVARDFVSNMTNVEKVKSSVTPDAMASGGVLPQAIPMMEAMKVASGLAVAFPDIKFNVQKVTTNGNKATVDAVWSGTNTGPLSLPGSATIPPTGKKVSVKDSYLVTVQGDKVSHMEVQSPADGGIPAALAQIGVHMPSM
jgi:predicted ester cyclase